MFFPVNILQPIMPMIWVPSGSWRHWCRLCVPSAVPEKHQFGYVEWDWMICESERFFECIPRRSTVGCCSFHHQGHLPSFQRSMLLKATSFTGFVPKKHSAPVTEVGDISIEVPPKKRGSFQARRPPNQFKHCHMSTFDEKDVQSLPIACADWGVQSTCASGGSDA